MSQPTQDVPVDATERRALEIFLTKAPKPFASKRLQANWDRMVFAFFIALFIAEFVAAGWVPRAIEKRGYEVCYRIQGGHNAELWVPEHGKFARANLAFFSTLIFLTMSSAANWLYLRQQRQVAAVLLKLRP